jgi:uncharacterized protein (DUF2141 family)
LAASLVSASVTATSLEATLDLSVTGLRNNKGQVMVCMTANPKAFPDCRNDANAHKRLVAAANAKTIRFAGVARGTYAISLVHDENSNGKLDTSVMIPREGFGFSRNPTITFGPPKFKSAAFTLDNADASQSVKMKYML